MVCSPPLSRSTPSMVRRLEPIPEIWAPRPTRNRHRSWTWGSQAALPMTVVPSASTAAMMAFSVAVTDASSRNIGAPRSRPTSSSRARSKLAWTPRLRKASRWVSSRSRPITSPPGGGSRQWPVRATSGAASSTDARMRVHRAGSRVARRRPRGSMRTSLEPSRSTLAPVEATSSSMVSTSRIWGTLRSTTGSSASRQAATMGSAAFLFPEGRMVPLSGCPPLMTKLSMTLPARGRSGARPPTLPLPHLGPVKLRPRRLSRPARTLVVPVQLRFRPRRVPPHARVQARQRHAGGRRPAGGHRRPGRRPRRRRAGRHPAGRDRLGQDPLDGRGDRAPQPAGPGHGAQQDARGPAHQRVQGAVPRQRCRVLRLLLRLLPAQAYIPQTDTYIEKDSSMNEEIDRLRHSATLSLLTRRDVIVVASVSAIYGLGSPQEYRDQMLWLKRGESYDRDGVLRKLVDIHYDRNDLSFVRGKFRVRGDTLEVFPAYEERAMRLEFFGDEVERILVMDPVTGEIVGERDELYVFPATHYVAGSERMRRAIAAIEAELADRLAELERDGKLLEAQRLRMRTNYDLEMLREVGTCNGIENYSRPIDGRAPGSPPFTLLDYFPDDLVLFLDESHVTVPQLQGQYEGDHSRKVTLVEHGFRLPSAMDNRPLRFDEFWERIGQRVFVSATPGPYERRESGAVVEQIIRPTGLVDPEVIVRPTKGQIDDLIHEVRGRVEADQRVLVTTLTKKMAEDLTDYLLEMGLRVRYLHSEIDTVQRIEILRDLRLGEFDTLVGINLLREGLDLPEVTLVAILDADKEGFLRSETSLVQTIGRAARNVDGQVIMYADQVTPSMQRAIEETNRRRKLQIDWNTANGIDPQTVRKRVTDIIQALRGEEEGTAIGGRGRKGRAPTPARGRTGRRGGEPAVSGMPRADLERLIVSLEEEMHEAAKDLRFEYAARIRDEVGDLRRELRAMAEAGVG